MNIYIKKAAFIGLIGCNIGTIEEGMRRENYNEDSSSSEQSSDESDDESGDESNDEKKAFLLEKNKNTIVVGCGHKFLGHNHSGSITIDPNAKSKPDIV